MQKHGLWHQTLSGSVAPSKCLPLSELYLLCTLGRVRAPPRRAVEGLQATELIKAVPVHSHH